LARERIGDHAVDDRGGVRRRPVARRRAGEQRPPVRGRRSRHGRRAGAVFHPDDHREAQRATTTCGRSASSPSPQPVGGLTLAAPSSPPHLRSVPADTERLSAALAERYAIERALGQGGMATVYLARDLKHDRRVAIKVLKPELAAVLGAERFVVEIKTTASLQHPHILPLFDSGEADGFLYYVMP